MKKWFPALMLSALLLTACTQSPSQTPEINTRLVVVNNYAMPISNQLNYPKQWNKFREDITAQLNNQLIKLLKDLESQQIKTANTNQTQKLFYDVQVLVFSLNNPPRPALEANQAARALLDDLDAFQIKQHCPELTESLQKIINKSAPLLEQSDIPEKDLLYCAKFIGFELNYLGSYINKTRITASKTMVDLDRILIKLFKELPSHQDCSALLDKTRQAEVLVTKVLNEEKYPALSLFALQKTLERTRVNLELCSLGAGSQPQSLASPASDAAGQEQQGSSPAAGTSGAGTSSDNGVQIAAGQKIALPSGLKYTKLQEGQGQPCKAGDTVAVHYKGTLSDGTVFDSSYDREPFVFPLGKGMVIEGWEQGIAGMRPGEKRLLVIPPELAYGDKSTGPIPPNSTLTFEVELIKIK